MLLTNHTAFLFHFFCRYCAMDFSDSEGSEDDSFINSRPVESVQRKPAVVGKKHLEDIKDMLGLESYQMKLEKKRRKRKAAKARKAGNNTSLTGAVQTAASRSLGLTTPLEVVTFIDHKKRSKSAGATVAPVLSEKQTTPRGGKEVTMKQARFEVFKFGVAGMDKKSQEEANTALALRLGAKPQKNKGVDYKQLKEDRIKEKEEKKVKEEEHRNSLQGVRKSNKSGMTAKKSANKSKKKGKKGEFKVGAFDGGMLKLSQKDISSIKSKRKS